MKARREHVHALYPLMFMLLFLLSSAPAGAEKVTADPNAPGARAERIVQSADPRLAQKVTYHGGYKRLSAIADEITKQTGVTIRSGSSPKDWRVRDIPMVVAVKDVPLGKLLEAVAACAHVKLTAEKIGPEEEETPSYRLARSKAMQEDIDKRTRPIKDANRELASWAWDALVAYAAKPEAKLTVHNKYAFFRIDSEQVRLVAEALACMGPEVRQRAFSGEAVTLTYSTFPRKDLLRKICNYAAGHPEAGTHGSPSLTAPVTPTDEEVKQSLLVTTVRPKEHPDETDGFTFMAYGIPHPMPGGGHFIDSWEVSPIRLADALVENKVSGIPAKPDVKSKLHPHDEFPVTGFAALSSDEDWKAPLFQQKVVLGLTKTRDGPVSADVQVELARKSGLSIVSEDFVSQKEAMYSRPRIDLAQEHTVAELLKSADWYTPLGHMWLLNSEDKLLCGWTNQWRERHQALVPEKLLSGLREKRKTTGAELDDVLPITMLTQDQREQWIDNTQDHIYCGSPDDDRPLWQFYAGLDDENKAAAKSDAGLPFAKLDTQWISEFFIKARDEEEARTIRFSAPEEMAHMIPDWLRKISSPDILPHLSLRVVRTPVDHWDTVVVSDTGYVSHKECWAPKDGSITKHVYRIEVFGKLDGEVFTHESKWEMKFPYYTVEREGELAAKAVR